MTSHYRPAANSDYNVTDFTCQNNKMEREPDSAQLHPTYSKPSEAELAQLQRAASRPGSVRIAYEDMA